MDGIQQFMSPMPAASKVQFLNARKVSVLRGSFLFEERRVRGCVLISSRNDNAIVCAALTRPCGIPPADNLTLEIENLKSDFKKNHSVCYMDYINGSFVQWFIKIETITKDAY